eukprot:SAG31_NODE_538_length_14312_cov_12.542461_5_plen_72_part_00
MAPIYATFGCQRDASTLCALGGDDEAECVVSQLKSQTLLTRLGTHPASRKVSLFVNFLAYSVMSHHVPPFC